MWLFLLLLLIRFGFYAAGASAAGLRQSAHVVTATESDATDGSGLQASTRARNVRATKLFKRLN